MSDSCACYYDLLELERLVVLPSYHLQLTATCRVLVHRGRHGCLARNVKDLLVLFVDGLYGPPLPQAALAQVDEIHPLDVVAALVGLVQLLKLQAALVLRLPLQP